ncbi:FepA family TonB-dependent siderophore receptor [Paenirhodobacter sp.]|uniref:FepA family TonB-dependent siderophore receptor n=1 Tax=Paenirhodobacter sp. TaxID=1965326 RepID=UPI003B42717C
MIERIEVLRGPAAARYGSGAAGGVVNIITKKPEKETWSFGLHHNAPQNSKEGKTSRANLMYARPLGENFSIRLMGNYNKKDGDKATLNEDVLKDQECFDRGGNVVPCTTYPAGMEGVVNKDATVRLSWEPTQQDKFDLDLGMSRQGNIYAGDVLLGGSLGEGGRPLIGELANEGKETNVMRRRTGALTHTGDYGWGRVNSYLQWENTKNTRLSEGMNGSGEGAIDSDADWDTARMTIWSGRSEVIFDRQIFGRTSAITLGAEMRQEKLDLSDYEPNVINFDFGHYRPDPSQNDPITKQLNVGLYAEANIPWNDRLTLTPSIRYDWADTFGTNLSGGMNAAYQLTPEWQIKGGIARAFKSPNLYQQSEQYAYRTGGGGCPYFVDETGTVQRYVRCAMLGNQDLKPETSINKEIGVAFNGANEVSATLTYFHNNYHDKIQASPNRLGTSVDSVTGEVWNVFKWDNIPDAVVSGLEGSVAFPVHERVKVAINGTYMIKSEQKLKLDGGKTVTVPLSLVPDYTINASLEYQVTDQFSVIPSLTHFGKIEAASTSATTGGDASNTKDRSPYTLVNLAMSYEFENGVRLNGGVTNLFDKTILRSGEGANTYNEPGRAFYLGLTATF